MNNAIINYMNSTYVETFIFLKGRRERPQKYIEKYEVIETKEETIGYALNLWLEQKRGEWKSSTYANNRKLLKVI